MDDCVTAFAPGRVNLVGEHTDYNDGLALPVAIEAGVTVMARTRPGGRITVAATDVGEEDAFELDDVRPADGWRAYVRGVAAELGADGFALRGADLSVTGTVPQGSGLSSSAALEAAVALALLAAAGVDPPPAVALARVLSRAENVWTGAETGLLDQLASLRGEADHALLIDFGRLRTANDATAVEPVPLRLDGWTLATVDSGATHSLGSGSGYADRRRECREACERLGVASLRDAPADAEDRLPEPLGRRVRHVRTENKRVRAAVVALRDGDLPAFGRVLDASHASQRDDYEASVPAVEDAVGRCKAAGAAGARMVGGGFGGHVLALFGPGAEPPADALVVTPGPGASVR